MKVFHDSRNIDYRTPCGVVAPGETVTLRLDIGDAGHAKATLRTWVDGVGESLHEMHRSTTPDADADVGAESERFEVKITPEGEGVVWYHFIITDEAGDTKRYGTFDGKFGGEGQLRDWEPPSFQLTVSPAAAPINEQQLDDPTFADALVGFLRNERTAYELVETIAMLRENRRPETFARIFDPLETMDRMRLFLRLSGVDEPADADAESEKPRLDDRHAGLAKGRLWCTSLIQALLPELPASYDGDEDAAEPWGTVDFDCKTIVENALDLRRALPLFENGSFECDSANADVFALWRRDPDGQAAVLLINASIQNAHDVLVPLENEMASEIISGYGLPIVEAADAGEMPAIGGKAQRYARVHLYQLGSAVVYLHPSLRLQEPPTPGIGVLAHITSLPADGPGSLGAPARSFVDWLADNGVRYWQILPVNPTDQHGSPYAGISAFAGNARLLGTSGQAASDLALRHPDEYREFCERESDWLEPYACFMATRQKRRKGVAWQDWPKKYRHFDPASVEGDKVLQPLAEQCRREQFAFDRQWHELRTYANDRGVEIVGDMPIYVSADSSDVWANPEIFQLDSEGRPLVVAGCPPDQFAVDGQIWGNPVYDWDVLKAAGYDWWLRRLKRAFDLYDIVRLDHFIGFCRYFSIPADGKATEGSYRPGPGIDLFRAAYDTYGPLPIIAEDLGSITPAVRALVAACGFPGMDIAQFVDGNDPLSGYTPRPEKIAYTGTHDNQTLVGYCAERYPDENACEAANRIMDSVAACTADVRVFPLQDVMGLDDDARMNVPGTVEGNWIWQASQVDVERAAQRMQHLVQIAKRP